VQTHPLLFRFALFRRSLSPFSLRDYGDQQEEFLPCVSCIQPLLDGAYWPHRRIFMTRFCENNESVELNKKFSNVTVKMAFPNWVQLGDCTVKKS